MMNYGEKKILKTAGTGIEGAVDPATCTSPSGDISTEFRRLVSADTFSQTQQGLAGWSSLADWLTPRNRAGKQPREIR